MIDLVTQRGPRNQRRRGRTVTIVVVILATMAGFGVGVNRFFAAHKHSTPSTATAVKPTQTRPEFTLPGTIYFAAAGRIYVLNGSTISELGLPAESGRWTQPVTLPDGTLLVVLRNPQSSDLYHVSSTGAVIAKLTSNDAASVQAEKIRSNHWIFWPAMSADGSTLFFAEDSPKAPNPDGYEVDFNIWSGTIDHKLTTTQWGSATYYTGGNTMPQPTPSGGLLYVSYNLDASGKVLATVVYQPRPRSQPVPLTLPADDCFAIALSPDGMSLAMTCSGGGQTVSLRVAHFDQKRGTLGTPTTLVPSCLCNSPLWSPHSTSLLYLAPSPSAPHGLFQLWYIGDASAPIATAGTPSASGLPQPRQITDGIDADATSAPAWVP